MFPEKTWCSKRYRDALGRVSLASSASASSALSSSGAANSSSYAAWTYEKVSVLHTYIYMLICCDFSKWCICFWYMFWYDLVCHMSNIIIIVVVLLLIVIVIIITVFVIHAPAPKWSWNQLFLCTQLPRPLSSPWAFLVVGPWLRTVPGVPRFSAPFQTIRNAFRNERYMV
jgi:hypothetical protein